MASKDVKRHMQLIDTILRGKIESKIHYKVKVLVSIILLLILVETVDNITNILFNKPGPIGYSMEIAQLFTFPLLGLFAFHILKNLEDWEDTYNQVKKIIIS